MESSPFVVHASSYCVLCGEYLKLLDKNKYSWPILERYCPKCEKIYTFKFDGTGPDVTMNFSLSLFDAHFFQMVSHRQYVDDKAKKYTYLFTFARFECEDAGVEIVKHLTPKEAKQIQKDLSAVCGNEYQVKVYKCTRLKKPLKLNQGKKT